MTPARIQTSLLLAGLCGCAEPTFEVDDMDVVSEATRLIYWKQVEKKVDILVVIDDSAAMAGAQSLLAANFGAWISVLEADDVDVDYRIGVIDAAASNPACAAGVDAGVMRLASCRGRAGDFVDASGDDLHAEGCTDVCSFETIATQATTTEYDPMPRPRPWLERNDGHSNVAHTGDRVPTVTEALECVAPQGVAGCALPAPLEAMYQALLRTQDEGDPQYGFLRSDASLLVLLVSNGNECSVMGQESAPTPAACWKAGVECSGGPGEYDECHAVNDGVLHPLSRYLELIDALERGKQAITPNARVLVELIAGVPPGFDVGPTEVSYADATDPEEQLEYGIGAGCVHDGSDPPLLARPPVRELEVALATRDDDRRPATSICQDDYSGALSPLAEAIRDQFRPACMPVCVADADRETPELEPTCRLDRATPGPDGALVRSVVHPCNADATIPAGEDVCAMPLVDDAESFYCSDLGWNLEYQILWREFATVPIGTTITATCLLSQQPHIDCPNLP